MLEQQHADLGTLVVVVKDTQRAAGTSFALGLQVDIIYGAMLYASTVQVSGNFMLRVAYRCVLLPAAVAILYALSRSAAAVLAACPPIQCHRHPCGDQQPAYNTVACTW